MVLVCNKYKLDVWLEMMLVKVISPNVNKLSKQYKCEKGKHLVI
jgi:hypothetical protein